MQKALKNIRIIFLILAIITSLVLTGVQLMSIQVVNGQDYLAQSIKNVNGVQEIVAPRGEILDSKLTPLVMNKVEYDAVIEYALFPKDVQEQNAIILKFAEFLQKEKAPWESRLPITTTKPYKYTEEQTTLVKRVLKDLNLNVYATADNVIEELKKKYKIDDKYTEQQARIIAGIRYEMIYTQFTKDNRYVFSKDIPKNVVLKIKELSYQFSGIDIIETAKRTYPSGTVFPHGLGTVGPLDADEYKANKDKGYKLNDTMGKSGIEKAMEAELRGTNGTRSVLLNSTSQIVSIKNTKDAVPGNNVVLTIDSGYQTKVQDLLAAHIKTLQQTKKSKDSGQRCNAGAIVVLDVKTGAVKAMASYPGYDINNYYKDYKTLNTDPSKPLFNRALSGSYRPGSTFKTITATAGLNEGVIDENSVVHCGGTYTYFSDFRPGCFTGPHGNITVRYALKESCNIFFYDVGRRLGVTKLADYEKMYGFGTDLKFELPTRKGYIATKSTFDEKGWLWDAGQVLMASIGQSEISVTPLNMAVQALTLANKGKRFRPYIVDSVVSYDKTTVVKKTEPIVDTVIQDKTGKTFNIIKDGMVLAGQGIALPHPVAIKTGTPQNGSWEDGTTKFDNAVVGYYPAENPEICFAVMLDAGMDARATVKKIIDAYYGTDKVVQGAQNKPAQ